MLRGAQDPFSAPIDQTGESSPSPHPLWKQQVLEQEGCVSPLYPVPELSNHYFLIRTVLLPSLHALPLRPSPQSPAPFLPARIPLPTSERERESESVAASAAAGWEIPACVKEAGTADFALGSCVQEQEQKGPSEWGPVENKMQLLPLPTPCPPPRQWL